MGIFSKPLKVLREKVVTRNHRINITLALAQLDALTYTAKELNTVAGVSLDMLEWGYNDRPNASLCAWQARSGRTKDFGVQQDPRGIADALEVTLGRPLAASIFGSNTDARRNFAALSLPFKNSKRQPSDFEFLTKRATFETAIQYMEFVKYKLITSDKSEVA